MNTLPGKPAPEFRLQDQDGKWQTLADMTARRSLLIAFYPGDFTLVCTKQLCSYQDNYGDFEKLGIEIVGISPNTPESHRDFRKRYHFQFPLLSDPDKAVFKSYGVVSLFMFGGTSRAVFVVAGQGSSARRNEVIYRYIEPTVLTHRKAGELLEILTSLKNRGEI